MPAPPGRCLVNPDEVRGWRLSAEHTRLARDALALDLEWGHVDEMPAEVRERWERLRARTRAVAEQLDDLDLEEGQC